jgi:hypothetical protein
MGCAPGLVPVCMGGDLGWMGPARINMVVSGKNRLGSDEEQFISGQDDCTMVCFRILGLRSSVKK